MSRVLTLRPLDAAGFAPFGVVTPRPEAADTTAIAGLGAAANLRPGRASASPAWFVVPGTALPFEVRVMERHRFSSQSFLPCESVDWLVVAAPHAGDGGPDMDRAAAFLAGPRQAITLRPDVWHHPLTALGRAAFAVVTCLAGDSEDEEFRDLPQAWTVTGPSAAR